MTRSSRLFLVLTLVVVPFAVSASGQVGGGFALQWNTVDGGASTASTGGNFSLVSTVAQPDSANTLAGGSFAVDGGFDPGICGSFISTYGMGCPGSGFFTPTYNVEGCMASGEDVITTITQGLGGGFAFVFIGINQAALPVGGGCLLNVNPILVGPVGPIPLFGAGPGNGQITFPTTLPPIASIVAQFTAQVFIADPGAPSGTGFSNTNGVLFNYGA